jgi:dethiobiotin synthetase
VTVAVTPNLARSNVLVIAGTDTSVGKTWVASALARALRSAGRRVIGIKVVETGCTGPRRDTEDGVLLARASGQAEPAEALVRLAAPLTPALAAEREGMTLDFDDILLRIEGYARGADIAIVEGTGGLLAPMSWEWNLVDLAQALEARALVVGRDRLGTVSHALLTLSALEIGAVPVAAVVLTPPPKPDGSTGTNASTIERLSGLSGILEVPHITNLDEAAATLAPLAERLISP